MDTVWGYIIVHVQQAEDSRPVDGVKGLLENNKSKGKWLTYLLYRINTIICRDNLGLQLVP